MSMSQYSTNTMKTSTATISRIHDRIVLLKASNDVHQETTEQFIENLEGVHSVGQKGYCFLLTIPSPNVIPSPNTRKLFEKEMENFPYVAVVINNLAQRILINFVASITGKNKLRMFLTEELAMEWLLSKTKK